MIRDLLDVASIEVGRLSVERREVALTDVIGRAVELFAREAEERGVTLRAVPAAHAFRIVGDEERLVQVLANLLGNAMRYTERGGSVVVRSAASTDEVAVSVEDTGAGIAPSELPLIFERYWTVRGNAPKGGTGLGLAIARGIVEAHGGRLWAESEVGKGSIFRFTLRTA
jgi:signal transduction histidine kinase